MSSVPVQTSLGRDPEPTRATVSTLESHFNATELLVASCLLQLFLDARSSSVAPAHPHRETDFLGLSGLRLSSAQGKKRKRDCNVTVKVPEVDGDVEGVGLRLKVPRYRDLSDIYSKSASVELR
ncbi:hypothetical protein KP509_09G070300 [Ceratopteris richardii]|uniref:Uncharacterized protein n=1 Tax=Ceratopteris richardii TaxID=49495 RepID=A0A8T2U8I9_CERRI|nr:hypothetical protein KP509_09G070300 [Ceratopteris richardii]